MEQDKKDTNALKYKVGDKVRIKSKAWYDANKNESNCVAIHDDTLVFSDFRVPFCGREAVIMKVLNIGYEIDIDNKEFIWQDYMLDEDNIAENTLRYRVGDKVRIKDLDWYENHKNELNPILENHGDNVFQDWIKEYGGKEAVITEIAEDSPKYRLEIPNFEGGHTLYMSLNEEYFYKPNIERVGDFLLISNYDLQSERPTGERHLISINDISHIYKAPKEKNLISMIIKGFKFHIEATLEEVVELLKQK